MEKVCVGGGLGWGGVLNIEAWLSQGYSWPSDRAKMQGKTNRALRSTRDTRGCYLDSNTNLSKLMRLYRWSRSRSNWHLCDTTDAGYQMKVSRPGRPL